MESDKKIKLSIIIPVYNEESTILEIIKRVEEAKTHDIIEKEIIIIDDYSTDKTRALLLGLNDKHKIFFHDKNLGKGAAIKTGLTQVTGDIILIQDADLEYDPNDYYNLLDPILKNETKVVFGSRFLGAHKPRYKIYYLGNILLSWLTSLIFLQKITDMETCYKVFHRDVLSNIKIKSQRFNFEPEITAKVIKAGHKIKEVPIRYSSRSFAEGKKISWHDGVLAFYYIIKFRFFN